MAQGRDYAAVAEPPVAALARSPEDTALASEHAEVLRATEAPPR